MEIPLALAFVFLCFAAAFLVSVYYQRAKYRKQVAALGRLSEHLDDVEVESEESWYPELKETRVRASLAGRRVQLGFRDGSGGDRTYLVHRVAVGNPPPNFTVKQAGVLRRVGRFLGLVEDVSTGDARVDRKYAISGRQGSLSELFGQADLEHALDAAFERGFEEVRLEDGEVVAEREQPLRKIDENVRILESLECLARVATLCEREAVTVTFLGPRRRFAYRGRGKQPRCPYCHDDLDLASTDLAACESCDTVHHAECFEEAKGCTVLGCASQRAAPRAAGKA